MLLKIVAFVSAAIPLLLFIRAIVARRPSRLGLALREAKKQVDLAINLFLGIVACLAVFALGKIAWTWWATL